MENYTGRVTLKSGEGKGGGGRKRQHLIRMSSSGSGGISRERAWDIYFFLSSLPLCVFRLTVAIVFRLIPSEAPDERRDCDLIFF